MFYLVSHLLEFVVGLVGEGDSCINFLSQVWKSFSVVSHGTAKLWSQVFKISLFLPMNRPVRSVLRAEQSSLLDSLEKAV